MCTDTKAHQVTLFLAGQLGPALCHVAHMDRIKYPVSELGLYSPQTCIHVSVHTETWMLSISQAAQTAEFSTTKKRCTSETVALKASVCITTGSISSSLWVQLYSQSNQLSRVLPAYRLAAKLSHIGTAGVAAAVGPAAVPQVVPEHNLLATQHSMAHDMSRCVPWCWSKMRSTRLMEASTCTTWVTHSIDWRLEYTIVCCPGLLGLGLADHCPAAKPDNPLGGSWHLARLKTKSCVLSPAVEPRSDCPSYCCPAGQPL
jgi:hypothetical protein